MRALPNLNWIGCIALPAMAVAISGCAQQAIDERARSRAPAPVTEEREAEEPSPQGHFEPVEPDEGEPRD